jgi:predicted RND superfamily exporter protein
MRPPGIHSRIDAGFESWGHSVFRHAWTAIALTLLVTLGFASQLPSFAIDATFDHFLHRNDPVLVTYERFVEEFGREEIVLVAIRPPDVFDLEFLGKLQALHADLEREVPYTEEITSLVSIRSIRGEDDELVVRDLGEEWPREAGDLAEFRQRVLSSPLYRNLLISEDGRLTTLVIETQAYLPVDDARDALSGFDEVESLPEAKRPRRRFMTGAEDEAIVAAVHGVLDRYEGPDFQAYVAGPPALGTTIMRAVRRDMSIFVAFSVLAIIAFLFVLFRRLSGVLLPLLIVVLALVSTLGLMASTGTPIRLPTQILPSFLLAVGVGDTVHVLVIFFRNFQQGRSKEQAIAYALGHSGLAIVMTSLTTAGGLLSFTAAEVRPIAELGVFAPAGVLFLLVYSVVLLPALIAVLPLRPRRKGSDEGRGSSLDGILVAFGEVAARHPWPVIGTWTLILAISLLGTFRITHSHNPLQYLPEGNSVRVATQVTDRELRGTMSLEVLVKTGVENGIHDPAVLNRLDELRVYAEGLEKGAIKVGSTVSIVDVVKEIHQALNENRSAFYAIPQDRKLVAQELLLFENSGSDDLGELVDPLFSTARFSIRVPWVDAVHYPPLVAEVERTLRGLLGGHAVAEITGLTVVLGGTIQAVMTSMIRSYLIAFLVITPLMVLLIGNLRSGLLSMVPNLAPIIVTLGLMGWARIPLDVFTLVMGCIAIGLAVDDTIHFMHNFERHFRASGDARRAIQGTLQTTGRAMLFTTLVLAAGFFIFMLSSLRPLTEFGFLTGFAIAVAFLADVLLAPALLVVVRGSPGRFTEGAVVPSSVPLPAAPCRPL